MPTSSHARSRSRSRPPTAAATAYNLGDSIASLSARATVAQAGVEALDSSGPLGVDLLYRWDGPDAADQSDEESRPSDAHRPSFKDPFTPAPGADEEEQTSAPDAGGSGTAPPPPPVLDEEDNLAWCRHLPWWKRPSDAMLRPFVFLLAVATGLVIPVKVEFFDQLACESLYFTAPATPSLPPTSPMLWLSGLQWFRSAPDMLAPHLPYGPDDPTLCHSPPVLARSASLQMRLTVVSGLLSVLTTGWWTGRSDRLGRRGVMAWSALGLAVNAVVYVITAMVPRTHLPGRENFMLVGAIFDGLVGGMPTAMATFSAYISDATPPGTKAVGFSMFLGLFYIALAVGPVFGGRIVAVSGLLSVFWVAAAITTLYFAFVLLLLPESCSPTQLAHAQKQHLARVRITQTELEDKLAAAPTRAHRLWVNIKFHVALVFQPLAVLAPPKVEVVQAEPARSPSTEAHETTHLFDPSRRASSYSAVSGLVPAEASASYISVSHVSKKWKRDYNLLLVALAMWFEVSVVGVLSSKMLYAQQHFHWGAPEMGGFMTAASLSRVLALTLILPLAIKLLHRPAHRIALPQDNDARHDILDHEGRVSRRASRAALASDAPYESDDDGSSDSNIGDLTLTETERTIEHAWTVRAVHLRLLHDSRFDLQVARISMLIAVVCYLGTATARTSGSFIAWTCFACLGAGAGAAISSLAVALLKDPKDAGRLFGANSMLSAIGQTVVSPIVFTRVYQATADTSYSWCIFVLAAGMFGLSFVILCLVRVRKLKSLPALPPRPASRPVSFAR